MISQSVKAAVARVVATSPSYSRAGTGFLISDRHLITAMHVVADRAAALRGGVPPPPTVSVTLHKAVVSTRAELVDGGYDPLHDWALLALEEPCAGVTPIPLAPIRHSNALRFEAFGFPADHSGGLVVAGDVSDAQGDYFGSEAIQLFCQELAAGDGDPMNGLSGAPCLVRNVAVGVIRAHPVKPGVRGLSADTVRNGVLFACPEAKFRDAVSRFLPKSERAHIPLGEFATGPLVPVHDVPLKLINAVAELHSSGDDAKVIVDEANDIKTSFDAPRDRGYVIRHSSLPDPGQGARKFWHAAFAEAGKHGPRMIAALLQATDVRRLDAEASRLCDELLQRLREIQTQQSIS